MIDEWQHCTASIKSNTSQGDIDWPETIPYVSSVSKPAIIPVADVTSTEYEDCDDDGFSYALLPLLSYEVSAVLEDATQELDPGDHSESEVEDL